MVYQIIKSKKRVFLEALILTSLILLIGVSIGFYIESYRANKIIETYKEFEIDVLDLRLQNYYYQVMDQSSCERAIEENLIFADKIYDEGLRIEKYEEAGKLKDGILLEKKRHVLLKTELWLNSILLKNKCDDPFHTVVYIYSQDSSSAKDAEQDAISNVLKNIKEERGNEIILIPIGGDLELDSVDIQLRVHNITYLPSIIIDENYVLEGFTVKEDINVYLE